MKTVSDKLKLLMERDIDILIKYICPGGMFIIMCEHIYNNDFSLAVLTGLAFVVNLTLVFYIDKRKTRVSVKYP